MPEKIHIRFIIILISLFLAGHSVIRSQAKKEYSDIPEAVSSTHILMGSSGPRNVQWVENGTSYSYTTRNTETGHTEIRQYFPGSREDKLLLDTGEMAFPSTGEPFNYNSYKWSDDYRHLVFETKFRPIYRYSGLSDYYLYSTEDKTLKLLVKDARTAELSPDGSLVGLERAGNLYVYNIKEGIEKQITDDASDTVYNGHFDWVYEEEFDIAKGWEWSPDSKYVAYWQVDESNEPVFQMTDYETRHPDYVKFRVPLVGDPNAKVKIGVVNLAAGSKIWLNVDDEYIPRIYWTSVPNQLAVMTLNRKQNNMKLYFFNVLDGSKRLIFEEKSENWIDINSFFEGGIDLIYFPDTIKEFFWISDRDGYPHIYRYDYDGKLIAQVTQGEWAVTGIEGINPGKRLIYYISTGKSPLERQLYSIGFDGSAKQRISKEPGKHSFNLSPDTKYYIDIYSSVNMPKQVELRDTDGKLITRLENNDGITQFIELHKYSPAKLFNFTTADDTRLDGEMVLPFDFDSTKKYPVIFDVYGGPGSQGVFNSFEVDGWRQWLAQNGYVIVDINNRGNGNYGSKFMKIVYKQLGRWESNDYTETMNYLSSLPYIDTSRTAIMGTSYGGYITIYTMLMHAGIFKAGIANSAVTDWTLYDDIYTERYMGLIDENKEAYDKSSDVCNAGKLDGHLLIVHSTLDDNVHVQNTMQMLTALTNAGKDADLRIYPAGGHGAFYSMTNYMLMLKVYFDYLEKHLK
ncbi:MAG TPA: S9 family peptidase [Ignavibacteriaceae bacterium]|nr:S9 family peptidase [Ignavibacteriaceae bacterium]